MRVTRLFICSRKQQESNQMARCSMPQCEGCINREFDPFRCDTCVEGSNWEGENTEEELTYAEFKDLFGEAA